MLTQGPTQMSVSMKDWGLRAMAPQDQRIDQMSGFVSRKIQYATTSKASTSSILLPTLKTARDRLPPMAPWALAAPMPPTPPCNNTNTLLLQLLLHQRFSLPRLAMQQHPHQPQTLQTSAKPPSSATKNSPSPSPLPRLLTASPPATAASPTSNTASFCTSKTNSPSSKNSYASSTRSVRSNHNIIRLLQVEGRIFIMGVKFITGAGRCWGGFSSRWSSIRRR